MTDLTLSVLGALVNADRPLKAREVAERLELEPLGSAGRVVSALWQLCDVGLAQRIAGIRMRYEVMARGRAVWHALQDRSGIARATP